MIEHLWNREIFSDLSFVYSFFPRRDQSVMRVMRSDLTLQDTPTPRTPHPRATATPTRREGKMKSEDG